jgi:hypothetical protein
VSYSQSLWKSPCAPPSSTATSTSASRKLTSKTKGQKARSKRKVNIKERYIWKKGKTKGKKEWKWIPGSIQVSDWPHHREWLRGICPGNTDRRPSAFSTSLWSRLLHEWAKGDTRRRKKHTERREDLDHFHDALFVQQHHSRKFVCHIEFLQVWSRDV